MILSVTPNSTIDWTIFLPYFRWNETIRSTNAVWGMAGKPADASWVLGELGVETLATGFDAGASGEKMVEMLETRNVETDFVWTGGETRINVHLVDQESGGQSLLAVDTLVVEPTHVEKLFLRLEKALPRAKALVTGGSLPGCMRDSGFFQRVILIAKEHEVPVAFDSSPPHLGSGLEARPTVIKPNRAELAGLVGRKLKTLEDFYFAARGIMEKTSTTVVVTMDEQGLLAVSEEKSWRVPALEI